jgi:hypothetical protein
MWARWIGRSERQTGVRNLSAETLLRLDEAIRTIFPPKQLKVELEIVDKNPDKAWTPSEPTPSGSAPPASPRVPLSPLEASRRSMDLGLGRRATYDDAPNLTPPPPPAPPKPGYFPAQDFSQKETCIKGNSVGSARNNFLGAFSQPESERPLSFPSAVKPPTVPEKK